MRPPLRALLCALAMAPRVVRGDLPGDVARCIRERVVTWDFPKPAGGTTVVVTYPWTFRPAAPAARDDTNSVTAPDVGLR